MGIDTGACKRWERNENNEVVFSNHYDEVEGTWLKYPNAEFVRLADTIEELSNGDIDLRAYLIWDDVDYENPQPDYERIIQSLKEFTFEKALSEGQKAQSYIEENYETVRKKYQYIYDPLEILEYLLNLWKNHYYVTYGY